MNPQNKPTSISDEVIHGTTELNLHDVKNSAFYYYRDTRHMLERVDMSNAVVRIDRGYYMLVLDHLVTDPDDPAKKSEPFF